MLDALFKSFVEPPAKPHGCTKRHRSSLTTEVDDEARAKKRERTELDLSRRASLVDEKACQIGA